MNVLAGNQPIYNLVIQAMKGELRLPFFQRKYVWNQSIIESFMLSFLNGEYLNSIIVAENKVDVKDRYLPFVSHIRELYDIQEDGTGKFLVIDGQQRLSTLVMMLFNDLIFFRSLRGRGETNTKELLVLPEIRESVDGKKQEEIYDKLKNDISWAIYQYLWIVKYVKKNGEWIAEELIPCSMSEIKSYIKEGYSGIVKMIKEKKNERELQLPVFVFRPSIIKKIGYDEIDKYNDMIKELKKEVMDDWEDITDRIRESEVTYVRMEDINNVESLAELFEKLNTVVVKLDYFDIMRAVLAKFKIEGEKHLDIEEKIGNIMKENKLSAVEKILDDKNKNKSYEYILRGLNFMKELQENGRSVLGLRRKTSKNEKTLAESLAKFYEDEPDKILEDLEEYLKSLDEVIRYFDKYTNLISKYGNIDGSLLLYGSASIGVGVKWKLGDSDYKEVAKTYLLLRLAYEEFFRHPDKAFSNFDRNSSSLSWKSIIGEDGIITEEIKSQVKRFEEILKSEESLKEELKKKPSERHLLLDPKNFDILLIIQSLANRGENLRTLDGEVITNLSKEGDIKFEDVDVHHIFPKSKNETENDNLLNLVLLHKSKNKKVADKLPKEYWSELNPDSKVLSLNLIPTSEEKIEEVGYDGLSGPEDKFKFWRVRGIRILEKLNEIFREIFG